MTCKRSFIQELPLELLACILGYLNFEEKVIITEVCSEFNEALQISYSWSKVTIHIKSIEDLNSFCSKILKCPFIQDLDLVLDRYKDTLQSINIDSLEEDDSWEDDDTLEETSNDINDILMKLKMLRCLKLSGTGYYSSDHDFPMSLQHFSCKMEYEIIPTEVAESFPALKYLECDSLDKFQHVLKHFCSSLIYLQIDNISELNFSSVFSETISNLKFLNINTSPIKKNNSNSFFEFLNHLTSFKFLETLIIRTNFFFENENLPLQSHFKFGSLKNLGIEYDESADLHENEVPPALFDYIILAMPVLESFSFSEVQGIEYDWYESRLSLKPLLKFIQKCKTLKNISLNVNVSQFCKIFPQLTLILTEMKFSNICFCSFIDNFFCNSYYVCGQYPSKDLKNAQMILKENLTLFSCTNKCRINEKFRCSCTPTKHLIINPENIEMNSSFEFSSDESYYDESLDSENSYESSFYYSSDESDDISDESTTNTSSSYDELLSESTEEENLSNEETADVPVVKNDTLETQK